MREIKFRAWNGHELQYSDDFNSNEAFWAITDDAGYGDFKTIYQQFTGLKDKNGREIYEGDILDSNYILSDKDYPYNWHERATVKYDAKLAKFGLTFYSPFGGEGCSGKEQCISDFLTNGWTVIGNIFENPELCAK